MGCASLHTGKMGYSENPRFRIWYEASLIASETFTKSLEIVPRYFPFNSGSLCIRGFVTAKIRRSGTPKISVKFLVAHCINLVKSTCLITPVRYVRLGRVFVLLFF